MVPSSTTTNTNNQYQRLPTTAEFLEEEPLYVNAKQYKRILKRRQARAKLEAEGKIPKTRQVFYFFLMILFNYHCHINKSIIQILEILIRITPQTCYESNTGRRWSFPFRIFEENEYVK